MSDYKITYMLISYLTSFGDFDNAKYFVNTKCIAGVVEAAKVT